MTAADERDESWARKRLPKAPASVVAMVTDAMEAGWWLDSTEEWVVILRRYDEVSGDTFELHLWWSCWAQRPRFTGSRLSRIVTVEKSQRLDRTRELIAAPWGSR